jgi:hypothetical protein
MSNNQLKIRIQIQQPPQAIEEIYPEPEIVYEQVLDWKKIAAAALLLLSVLVLTGYWLFAGNTDEKDPNAAIPSGDPVISLPENTTLPEKSGAELGTTNDTPGTQSGELITAQKIPSEPVASRKAGAASKPVAIPAKKPEPASAIDHPVITGKKIPKTAAQPKPEKTSDRAEVLRAQLSHAITAREPVDSIDAVQLRPGESKSIHFYVHLQNMSGKNIRIDWYYQNKPDSHLTLQVHNDNWRTHASKQLDHRRLGAWRVELMDESGNRLAARNFTVTQQ